MLNQRDTSQPLSQSAWPFDTSQPFLVYSFHFELEPVKTMQSLAVSSILTYIQNADHLALVTGYMTAMMLISILTVVFVPCTLRTTPR